MVAMWKSYCVLRVRKGNAAAVEEDGIYKKLTLSFTPGYLPRGVESRVLESCAVLMPLVDRYSSPKMEAMEVSVSGQRGKSHSPCSQWNISWASKQRSSDTWMNFETHAK